MKKKKRFKKKIITFTETHGEACVKAEYLKPLESLKQEAEQVPVDTPVCERTSFKKRPRDARVDPSTLLCRAVAAGEGCSFPDDKCKFSHDIADFFKRREKDLGSTCPVFEAVGYCRFGLNCRYGSSHINQSTKTNLPKPSELVESKEMNVLATETRIQLRKRTYEFKSMNRCTKGSKIKFQKESKGDGEALNLPERKKIDFKGKIYIAPLTTVGNLPFRRVMKHYGADITCGEMAMATNLLQGQASEWALLKRHQSEDIFGVQIAGGHGDQVSRVSELIAREVQVDFIDINMGCPIDLVCKIGAGSALMNRPKKLEEVVSAALTGIELGSAGKDHMPELTVKMRTGWDHKKPTARDYIPLVQMSRASEKFMNPHAVERFELSKQLTVGAFAIHGRSRLQRYTKTADYDYIGQCVDARLPDGPSMAMIGNGDVLSYEEFHEHLESGSLDTCMLARGALIKPWLPTEIKEKRHWDISASERLDILKEFVTFGLEHWGSDQKGVNTTRRFLLEWLSFLCRYIPVGLLERIPQHINHRPPCYFGRNDLETLFASDQATDWIKISEMLLGPVPEGFKFAPKHKANSYAVGTRDTA